MQKAIPVRYLDNVGWVAETTQHLNPPQLQAVARYAHKQLYGRMLDMPFGPNKDMVKEKLEILKLGKITQAPVKKDGGFPLFESTERQNSTIYSFPK